MLQHAYNSNIQEAKVGKERVLDQSGHRRKGRKVGKGDEKIEERQITRKRRKIPTSGVSWRCIWVKPTHLINTK